MVNPEKEAGLALVQMAQAEEMIGPTLKR